MKQIALLLVTTPLVATMAMGQSDPQASPEPSEQTVEYCESRINDYLNSKGWSRGSNKDGRILITVGISAIGARPGQRGYIGSRNNAFVKAMLNAKEEMVLSIGQELSRKISLVYSEPELMDEKESELENFKENGTGELGLYDKAELLIHSELDMMLAARGVDTSTPEGQQQAEAVVKTMLLEEKFSDCKESIARNEVSGLCAYKTFYSQPAGKQGEVGVICIYTEKNRMMADALLGRGDGAPDKEGKKPIMDYLGDENQVSCTFGVQPRIDENGHIVLVSIAHSEPRTSSRTSLSAAYKKARLNADSEIRSFAGEMVHSGTTVDSAETFQEFEDAAGNASQVWQSEESMDTEVSAIADGLLISGIQTIKQFEWTHPQTGDKGVTIVRVWSTKSSDQAKVLGKTLSKMSGSKGGAGRAAPKPDPSGSAKGKGGDRTPGSSSGEGLDGDDDAID